ncbi:MAG: enoyl-CoA hydratase/isomerase family protein [Acidimicrobiia bacterium]
MSLVEFNVEGRVARVMLNRPDKLNALSPDLLRELIAVCTSLNAEDQVGVVVLEGSGPNFSAGADLPAFAEEFESTPDETADLGRVAADSLAALPQITVASIRGHCVGGAVVLAAACDLRVAAEDARFWIPVCSTREMTPRRSLLPSPTPRPGSCSEPTWRDWRDWKR